jgi:hypothetical protein
MRPTNATICPLTGRPRRSRRVRAVLVDEVLRLGLGVGHQPVGGVGDLLLADDADQRLGAVAVREHRVLDLREGVRGVHQGYAPAVLGQPADLA